MLKLASWTSKFSGDVDKMLAYEKRERRLRRVICQNDQFLIVNYVELALFITACFSSVI